MEPTVIAKLGPAPILSRQECEDCGAKLEWNGERWGCPACEDEPAYTTLIGGIDIPVGYYTAIARSGEVVQSTPLPADFVDPNPSDDEMLDARDPWEARGLGGDW